MKRWTILEVVLLAGVLLAGVAGALDDIPVPADFYDGDAVRDRVAALEAGTGLGTSTNTGVTVAEAACSLVETTITISKTLTATDGSDEGESAKIFDCDEGMFNLLGAIADLTVVSSAGATGTVLYVAFGTAAAGDDSDLTSTEADVIPRTTLNPSAAGATTNDFHAVLATAAIFNGASAAKALYLNLAIDNDNMNAAVTNVCSGTLKLLTTKVLDY